MLDEEVWVEGFRIPLLRLLLLLLVRLMLLLLLHHHRVMLLLRLLLMMLRVSWLILRRVDVGSGGTWVMLGAGGGTRRIVPLVVVGYGYGRDGSHRVFAGVGGVG